MAISMQYIIESAYNRYSANDPGKLAVDGELIRHGNVIYQRLFAMMAHARPDEFGSMQSHALLGSPPTYTFLNGIDQVLSVEDAAGTRIQVITATDKSYSWNDSVPCVYRLGNAIISRNKARDPIAGAVLTMVVLDTPVDLTQLASTLDPRYPIRHLQLLIDLLATYLGTKDSKRNPADRAALAAEIAQGPMMALQLEFQLAPAAVSWMHASVQRAGVDAKLSGS